MVSPFINTISVLSRPVIGVDDARIPPAPGPLARIRPVQPPLQGPVPVLRALPGQRLAREGGEEPLRQQTARGDVVEGRRWQPGQPEHDVPGAIDDGRGVAVGGEVHSGEAQTPGTLSGPRPPDQPLRLSRQYKHTDTIPVSFQGHLSRFMDMPDC